MAEPVSFSTDSWVTIKAAVTSGNTSKYNVGDTKTVTLGSLGTYTVRIANKSNDWEHCGEEGYSQTTCGFVIEFADIITTYNMNPSGEYNGTQYYFGWNKDGCSGSQMYDYINVTEETVSGTMYNALPDIKYDSKVVSLPITVKIDLVKSIEIKQLPNKTTYIDGEDIKLGGLEVVAVYESGKKELIEDYTINTNKATLSINKIVISCLEYTCKFDITVEENSIIDLQITKKPNKLEYLVGEKFNTEGMIVTAEYKDGTKKEINDYKYPTSKLTINNKLIYIEYKGNKVPLNLTIINKQVVDNNGAQKPNKNPIQDIEDYTFIYGANQYITVGSGNTLRFEINSSTDLLDKIYINNKLLDINDYTISESEKNLSISINNSYLENLKPDEYSIEITLNNGKELSTKFLISNKNSDDMENNINKDDVVDKTSKFNFKWLYSLFIIPIVMVIIFLKRKLEK